MIEEKAVSLYGQQIKVSEADTQAIDGRDIFAVECQHSPSKDTL